MFPVGAVGRLLFGERERERERGEGWVGGWRDRVGVCVYVCFSKLALHRSLPEGGGLPACGAGTRLFLSRKPEERRRNVAPPPPLLRPAVKFCLTQLHVGRKAQTDKTFKP